MELPIGLHVKCNGKRGFKNNYECDFLDSDFSSEIMKEAVWVREVVRAFESH